MILTEATLILKTSRAIFWDALKIKTVALPLQSFPTEKGRIVVDWPKSEGENEMVCEGSHYIRKDERTEHGTSIGIVMSFAAFPRIDGGIDVIARCWQGAVMDYFKDLITKLENMGESGAAPGGVGEPGVKNKRGPQRYSDVEKYTAVLEWDNLDKRKYPIRLDEWLDKRFGNEAGVLNVKPSTFHGWRKKVKLVDTS